MIPCTYGCTMLQFVKLYGMILHRMMVLVGIHPNWLLFGIQLFLSFLLCSIQHDDRRRVELVFCPALEGKHRVEWSSRMRCVTPLLLYYLLCSTWRQAKGGVGVLPCMKRMNSKNVTIMWSFWIFTRIHSNNVSKPSCLMSSADKKQQSNFKKSKTRTKITRSLFLFTHNTFFA